MDTPIAKEFLDALSVGWSLGVIGIVGTIITFSVNIYKTNGVQFIVSHVPFLRRYMWGNLLGWQKWLFPIIASGVGALMVAYAGGGGIKLALLAAGSAIYSIVWHKGTKKTGEKLYANSWAKDKNYVPSPFRATVGSWVVPVPDAGKLEQIQSEMGK